MKYINFFTPPFPYFISAGSALYRPGDAHGRRTGIGVFDLVFVEYGELFITDDNTSYHLQENDILIINPRGTHYGHKKVTIKTKFDWLHFRATGEYEYTDNYHLEKQERKLVNSFEDRKGAFTLPVYKKLSPLEKGEFATLFYKLISFNIDKYQQKEIQEQAPLSLLECQETFFKLLTLAQVFQPQRNTSELLAVNIMEYILQNYHTRLTLDTMAAYFNFHPAHIIRCMKKEFNITPNKAITQVRIDNAKKMLITSNLSVAKISDFVGFTTPSYLNKVFKEMTGLTPKQYRSREREGDSMKAIKNGLSVDK